MAMNVKKTAHSSENIERREHAVRGRPASVEQVHETRDAELVGPFEGPTANVNVNLGARIGLPDFSDVRVGVSLTMPCDATEEGIEEAFALVENWCFEKVDELTQRALAEEE